MDELLRYLRVYEVWIYVVLGGVALWQLRKFSLAWDEVRGASFGLEREVAQSRLNRAVSMLVVVLLMIVAEFTLVYIIAPTVPGAVPIPTATLNILATPTSELLITVSPPVVDATETISPLSDSNMGEGCVPDQVMLTSPQNGETISGVVKIMGTAKIPNFGFYKYEIARPGDPIWLPLSANDHVIVDGELGEWVTSVLQPGDYMLRLVVTDNVGNSLPACTIQVRVAASQE
jgi:hypothetical protein